MSLQLPLSFLDPGSDWRPPGEFMRLSGRKIIGLDVETRDPRLLELGPGSFRNDGELVGISVAVIDELGPRAGYYPIRHAGGGNLPHTGVLSWLRSELKDPNITVVGANIKYDLEWLAHDKIEVAGRVVDVQVVEALIEEEAGDGMSLNVLSQKYLKTPKDEALLREAASAFGVDPKSGLWKLPARYVGKYAEWDSLSALLIYQEQLKQIHAEGLETVLDLETRLTPILWRMRRRGVRIDLEHAERLQGKLLSKEDDLRRVLRDIAGRDVDEWSSTDISRLCDDKDIYYPRTAVGNPSFTKDYINNHSHPLIKAIGQVREINRLRTVFVRDWVRKYNVNGRVHPEWKQLKSDDGGTRTGRMASANPNMQQIPARAEVAADVRAMVIPDEGHSLVKMDYSQQEPRILVHYASMMNLTGARLVEMAYKKNKAMDIYQFLADASKKSRKIAKGVTLGRMYGMGAKKFAAQQGLGVDEATRILTEFDASVPFVKELSDKCASLAQSRGYIKTLSGRRRHFNLWEPSFSEEYCEPLPFEEAQQKWFGRSLRRAGSQKALNALIQGSAADMTKSAMLRLSEEQGITPILQVHDELVVSEPDMTADKLVRIKDAVEHAILLRVPVYVDAWEGRHWK